MMILVVVLEMDGFFTLVAEKTISFSRTPFQLLTTVVFVTGISSAFLVNDAVVLLYTPVVIAICRSGRIDPVPYLIAEILAANIGSAMTITGNPQNILIGINSGIHYGRFLLYLLPVSLAGMAVTFFSGALIERIGQKKTIIIGILCLITGIFVQSQSETFLVFFIGFIPIIAGINIYGFAYKKMI